MTRDIPAYFNRKEIASMLKMTVLQVHRNEKQLGLLPARETINKRFVRYKALLVLSALEARGFLPIEITETRIR